MAEIDEKKRKRKEQAAADQVGQGQTSTERSSKKSKKSGTEVDLPASSLPDGEAGPSKQERKQARAERRQRKEERRLRRESRSSQHAPVTSGDANSDREEVWHDALDESTQNRSVQRTTDSSMAEEELDPTLREHPSQRSKTNRVEQMRDIEIQTGAVPAQPTQLHDWSTLQAVASAAVQNAEASTSATNQTPVLAALRKRKGQERAQQLASMSSSDILATQWLTGNELKELAKANDFTFKEGPFTTTEKSQVRNFLQKYRGSRNLTEQQLVDMINASGKSARQQHGSFWKDLAMSVPGRPLKSVHSHVKRAYDPAGKKGKWTRDEDDDLRAAYSEHGPQWGKVALRVDRSASDCKDRWRNHVAHSEVRQRGSWSKEEAESLRQFVLETAVVSGMSMKDTERDVPWQTISTKMGNARGPSQCRIKWTDDMLPAILSEKKKKWNSTDSVKMLRRLIEMNPRDTSEIDWNAVPYADWNAKSAHKCQINYYSLVRGVPGGKQMRLSDLLPILLTEARKQERVEEDKRQAKTRATLERADSVGASNLAGALAQQARYKSKAIIDDSDPDATDVEA